MELNSELLKDESYKPYPSDYKSCFNARGLYDSMQFVLRLRPDIHKLLEKTKTGVHSAGTYDFNTIQAYSTYLHETIHWWQHIGSISGLILSFSFPAQAHINHDHFLDYIKYTGLKKPITRYNEMFAKDYKPSDPEFLAINPILNNFYDIEFFKTLSIKPQLADKVATDKFFENIGHCHHIAYSSFISLLASTFDFKLKFLPNAKVWPNDFEILSRKKLPNYYYGSDIFLSPIGLLELYEGQARFTQMQFLYFCSGEKLCWDDFSELGMLSGVYYSAFECFLKLTNSKRPESIGDPLVALYLLIIDIAINPGEGFPFDIKKFENFVSDTSPGLRFQSLCIAVRDKHPELKTFVEKYTSSEYFQAANTLCKATSILSPIDISNKISFWSENEETIIELMKEEELFIFSPENQPVRLLFSRFVKLQQDKRDNPAFFCWAGAHCAGKFVNNDNLELFSEHSALFVDGADGDIYPKIFPNKDPKNVQKAFDTFYSWVVFYDLSRQWISEKGPFEFDYFWLTSKHSMDDLESWAQHQFKTAFGVDTSDFVVLD